MNQEDYIKHQEKYNLEIENLQKQKVAILSKGRNMTPEEFDLSVELTNKLTVIMRERDRWEQSANLEVNDDAPETLIPLQEPISHGPVLIHGVRDPMNP